jgi:hypothetical protein
MLGKYENFPSTIHRAERFLCFVPNKQLQQKIIQQFYNINQSKFSFEQVTNPTVPNCTLIFEFGLANTDGFSFIDKEEAQKAEFALKEQNFQVMDFFCSVRYYKKDKEKSVPLKFDYYLMRMLFGKGEFELQLFHERGPRYISPEDLTLFIADKVNEGQTRKILKRKETENPD